MIPEGKKARGWSQANKEVACSLVCVQSKALDGLESGM